MADILDRPDVAAVALIDCKACAQIGDAGESLWHEQVAAGIAPEAKIKRHRFVRWALAEVVEFWRRVGAGEIQLADPDWRRKQGQDASKKPRAAKQQRTGIKPRRQRVEVE